MYKKVWSNIMIIIIIFALPCCSTLPNSRSENNTLVIGEIWLFNKNSQYHNLPEILTSEIKIRFRSIETNNVIDVYSNESQEGLFHTTQLSEGIYEVVQFFFENNIINVSQEINYSRYFTVVKNKINNLGLMIWTIEDEYFIFEYPREYDSVKNKYYNYFTQTENDKWADREFLIYYYRNIKNGTFTREYNVRGDDSSRYQELWIFWHIISGKQLSKYPLPYKNETVKNWVERNLYLVKGTKIDNILRFSSDEIDVKKLFNDIYSNEYDSGKYDNVQIKAEKISALIPDNLNNLEPATLLFKYIDKYNILGSIIIAW